MCESLEDGAPFFFATREPPSATAIDDDIYLTVTTADAGLPGSGGDDRHHSFARLREACDRAAFPRRRAGDGKTLLSRSGSFLLFGGRQRDPQARAIVRGRAFEAVQLGDRGDEAEAEPGSGRRARRLGPVEALKDRLQLVGRDARAVVRDGKRNAAPAFVFR